MPNKGPQIKKSPSGFLYVLSNPCHEFLKIGQTKNDPLDRCCQISAYPGSPAPFNIAACWHVRDCRLTEKYVHNIFHDNRLWGEFFAVTVSEIEAVVKYFDPNCLSYDDYQTRKQREEFERLDALHRKYEAS